MGLRFGDYDTGRRDGHLREYQHENRLMTQWAACLIYRPEANRTFEHNCRRADFRLDWMEAQARVTEATP